jgi:cysteine desulfurase/selenocysteine lyase
VVTPRDPSRRAGILSFTVANLDRSAAALREGGVVFSVREGAIRLAPHFYNTVDEMERVVEILDAVA